MKQIILIVFCIFSLSAFSQFQFGETYAVKSGEKSTQYLKIYDDGLVLMVNTSDEYEKVQEYFNRESKESDYIVLYRSQAKIKNGSKASFVIENDGNKINCIAQGKDTQLTLVMMNPSTGKMQTTFSLIK